jgi:hypothetical protein
MPEVVFKLDEDDVKKLEEWREGHCGQLTYSFSDASGIGQTKTVTCHGCKAVLDLTDVSKW